MLEPRRAGWASLQGWSSILFVLTWFILQQCTAALPTQADDAAVLLQLQQQYGSISGDWVGDQPCGATAGELCLLLVDACHATQAVHASCRCCNLACRRRMESRNLLPGRERSAARL